MSNHESDNLKVRKLHVRKEPFFTLTSAAGDTLRLYIHSPSGDDPNALHALWLTVERDSGEMLRFGSVEMTERDMREMVHGVLGRLWMWSDSRQSGPKLLEE